MRVEFDTTWRHLGRVGFWLGAGATFGALAVYGGIALAGQVASVVVEAVLG